MSRSRHIRKDRFGTPERQPHLRIIFATIGPGKARLLELLAETHSLTEAARRMKMSYKRAWQLVEALNACFREPLVESTTGGRAGGHSRLTETGKQVAELYGAIHARSLAAAAKEMRRLHGLLKLPPAAD